MSQWAFRYLSQDLGLCDVEATGDGVGADSVHSGGGRVYGGNEMKYLELTIPGRPVPWARPRISKHGGMFTAKKQKDYGKDLAGMISNRMYVEGLKKFDGPVYLQVLFVYGKEPGTWMRLVSMESMQNHELIMPFELGEEFCTARPNLDNLLKILMDSIEASGALEINNDCIIAMVMAAKVKR